MVNFFSPRQPGWAWPAQLAQPSPEIGQLSFRPAQQGLASSWGSPAQPSQAPASQTGPWTSRLPGEVRLLDKSASRTGQPSRQIRLSGSWTGQLPGQVSHLDSSACCTGQLTGQSSWTGQPPGQASLLDRSARLDRSTFWAGQSPGHVNLSRDRSASRSGQHPRQVSLSDRSAYQQINFSDQTPGQGLLANIDKPLTVNITTRSQHHVIHNALCMICTGQR